MSSTKKMKLNKSFLIHFLVVIAVISCAQVEGASTSRTASDPVPSPTTTQQKARRKKSNQTKMQDNTPSGSGPNMKSLIKGAALAAMLANGASAQAHLPNMQPFQGAGLQAYNTSNSLVGRQPGFQLTAQSPLSGYLDLSQPSYVNPSMTGQGPYIGDLSSGLTWQNISDLSMAPNTTATGFDLPAEVLDAPKVIVAPSVLPVVVQQANQESGSVDVNLGNAVVTVLPSPISSTGNDNNVALNQIIEAYGKKIMKDAAESGQAASEVSEPQSPQYHVVQFIDKGTSDAGTPVVIDYQSQSPLVVGNPQNLNEMSTIRLNIGDETFSMDKEMTELLANLFFAGGMSEGALVPTDFHKALGELLNNFPGVQFEVATGNSVYSMGSAQNVIGTASSAPPSNEQISQFMTAVIELMSNSGSSVVTGSDVPVISFTEVPSKVQLINNSNGAVIPLSPENHDNLLGVVTGTQKVADLQARADIISGLGSILGSQGLSLKVESAVCDMNISPYSADDLNICTTDGVDQAELFGKVSELKKQIVASPQLEEEPAQSSMFSLPDLSGTLNTAKDIVGSILDTGLSKLSDLKQSASGYMSSFSSTPAAATNTTVGPTLTTTDASGATTGTSGATSGIQSILHTGLSKLSDLKQSLASTISGYMPSFSSTPATNTAADPILTTTDAGNSGTSDSDDSGTSINPAMGNAKNATAALGTLAGASLLGATALKNKNLKYYDMKNVQYLDINGNSIATIPPQLKQILEQNQKYDKNIKSVKDLYEKMNRSLEVELKTLNTVLLVKLDAYNGDLFKFNEGIIKGSSALANLNDKITASANAATSASSSNTSTIAAGNADSSLNTSSKPSDPKQEEGWSTLAIVAMVAGAVTLIAAMVLGYQKYAQMSKNSVEL